MPFLAFLIIPFSTNSSCSSEGILYFLLALSRSLPALSLDTLDQKPQLLGAKVVRGIPVTLKLWTDELCRQIFGKRFYRYRIGLSDLKEHLLSYTENKIVLARSQPL